MKIRKKENSYNLVCFYPGRAPQKAISKSTIRTVIVLANRKHGQPYTIESSTTLFVPCAKKNFEKLCYNLKIFVMFTQMRNNTT